MITRALQEALGIGGFIKSLLGQQDPKEELDRMSKELQGKMKDLDDLIIKQRNEHTARMAELKEWSQKEKDLQTEDHNARMAQLTALRKDIEELLNRYREEKRSG